MRIWTKCIPSVICSPKENCMDSPLDNPIWHALTGLDGLKNIGTDGVRYFNEDVAPFLGMPDWSRHYQKKVFPGIPKGRKWILLIKQTVDLLEEWKIENAFSIYQMTLKRDVPTKLDTDSNWKIQPLDSHNIPEMLSLTELTRPGPFTRRTIEFGNYHGIFSEGRLVAMGGERMHVNSYTEISAICTHPDMRGKGYGSLVAGYLSALILAKGQLPFLHVLKENETAIQVYLKLGFEIRSLLNGYVFSAE